MTVTNAASGLKNIIRLRGKLIKDLDVMTKDSKDEYITGIIDAIKDFMTRDIGSFEGILGEIQSKEITKMSHNNKKRK